MNENLHKHFFFLVKSLKNSYSLITCKYTFLNLFQVIFPFICALLLKMRCPKIKVLDKSSVVLKKSNISNIILQIKNLIRSVIWKPLASTQLNNIAKSILLHEYSKNSHDFECYPILNPLCLI